MRYPCPLRQCPWKHVLRSIPAISCRWSHEFPKKAIQRHSFAWYLNQIRKTASSGLVKSWLGLNYMKTVISEISLSTEFPKVQSNHFPLITAKGYTEYIYLSEPKFANSGLFHHKHKSYHSGSDTLILCLVVTTQLQWSCHDLVYRRQSSFDLPQFESRNSCSFWGDEDAYVVRDNAWVNDYTFYVLFCGRSLHFTLLTITYGKRGCIVRKIVEVFVPKYS